MKILAGLLVLSFATSAHAQTLVITIDVTCEHRTTNGETPDTARQLARIDAQRRAWNTAATRLQSHPDLKLLQLTPRQVEAFTAVLLELQEQSRTTSAAARGPVQVRLQGRLDGNETARRIALVMKDQDATFDIFEAWSEM